MSSRFRTYSRTNPSPQYSQLLDFYQSMHAEGYQQKRGDQWVTKSAEESFPGKKTLEFAGPIQALLQANGAKTVLDYGSGKGGHYAQPIIVKTEEGQQKFGSLTEFWQVDYVTTWEPGLGEDLPAEKHDAVICTDVLEHIYVADVFWVLDEIFRLASKCVFLNIACYPANAVLPNGENVHVTVRSGEWWRGVIENIAFSYPDIDYLVCCMAQNKKGERIPLWYQRPAYMRNDTESTALVTN